MPDDTSREFLRQKLGARLRELRLSRSLTVEEVAGRLLCSPSKISRMETGWRGASQRDVRDLCDIYEVTDEAERETLMVLAADARKRRSVASEDDRVVYNDFSGLEITAARITIYVSSLIPALFQTEAYGRAQFAGRLPDLDEDAIDLGVRDNVARQRVLTRHDSPIVEAFIDEAALHRWVGGTEVMAEQFNRLQRISRLPNVSVRIIPFSVGAHVGVESCFVVLEFSDKVVPNVVFVEGLAGQTRMNKSADVERYSVAVAVLRSTALDDAGSMRLISDVQALKVA